MPPESEQPREIPTVKIAVEEYKQLATKAEIYDLIVGVNLANARIAMLEKQLKK